MSGQLCSVSPGLDPGVHAFRKKSFASRWIAGFKPSNDVEDYLAACALSAVSSASLRRRMTPIWLVRSTGTITVRISVGKSNRSRRAASKTCAKRLRSLFPTFATASQN